jgi:hypothetical protein
MNLESKIQFWKNYVTKFKLQRRNYKATDKHLSTEHLGMNIITRQIIGEIQHKKSVLYYSWIMKQRNRYMVLKIEVSLLCM